MKARIAGVLAVLVTAVAIVSIGSSGAAATVTASNYTHSGCTAPGNVAGYYVYSLSQHAIGCDHAKHLLIENLAHGRRHTYSCNHSLRGTRDVHMHCTDSGNAANQYSAGYRVH